MWLEIITVRINTVARIELNTYLRECTAQINGDHLNINAFSFERTPSGLDVSIHLHHISKIDEASITGLKIADALRAFGPVDHAIWGPIQLQPTPI